LANRVLRNFSPTLTRPAASSAAAASTQIWRNFDFVLFGVTLVLIIYGILMIRSATLGAGRH
jgi:hypothetical protein